MSTRARVSSGEAGCNRAKAREKESALQETPKDHVSQLGVLLDKLRDAVRELLVVHRHALRFVEREERPLQENLRGRADNFGVRRLRARCASRTRADWARISSSSVQRRPAGADPRLADASHDARTAVRSLPGALPACGTARGENLRHQGNRHTLCSSFSGSANPLMMLPRISCSIKGRRRDTDSALSTNRQAHGRG